MSEYFLNKYTARGIGAQLIVCLMIAQAVYLLPGGDDFLDLLVYFYLPTIYLLTILPGKGEGRMFAPIMLGIPMGIVLYGLVLGLLATCLKRIRQTRLSD